MPKKIERQWMANYEAAVDPVEVPAGPAAAAVVPPPKDTRKKHKRKERSQCGGTDHPDTRGNKIQPLPRRKKRSR